MKKILSILLAVLLLAPAAGSAFAVTDDDADVWTAKESGFTLRIPEAYREAKGLITFSDAGEGMNPGSGIDQHVGDLVRPLQGRAARPRGNGGEL